MAKKDDKDSNSNSVIAEKESKEKKELSIQDLPGIGPATADKLAEAGFTDLMSIGASSVGLIVEATGMTETAVKKVINAARDSLEMTFMGAEQYDEKRKNIFHITTGVKAFDEMLDGGFESSSISECFGEFGSSKTQIAHQLAVNVQAMKNEAGEKGICIYVDTEGSFRPSRIRQMAKGQKLDDEEILRGIKVARAFSSDHQILLSEQIDKMIKEGLNVKLVIIDSLTSHFRAEFIGRGTLADRQQKLNKHMKTLAKIAFVHNVVVYVTNQVSADPAQFFGDPTKAIGGHIVGHNSTFRCYLRKSKKGSRVAKLIDAPNLPDAEAIFMVTEGGLKDL